MKKIILVIVAILFLGILIPLIFVRDSYKKFSQDDHDTILDITRHQLDNPIEQVLITKIVIDNVKDNTIYTSAYTLWGLKYATVELNLKLNGDSQATWRRWFGIEK